MEIQNIKYISNSYKNKKVFITGITGFKGSWLALLLKSMGAKVYGLGLDNKDKQSIYNQAQIAKKVATVYIADIRNKEDMYLPNLIMRDCDYVFHLAAQPLVSEGYHNPFETMEVNLMGTLAIQENLREARKKINYLNVTTDKVYKPSKGSHKESDTLFAEEPYGLSKSFSDMITKLYSDVYFKKPYKKYNEIKARTARAGNVIGGGDVCANRIIVDFFKSLDSGRVLQLRHPNSIRPYQYVLDCLIGYLYINASGQKENYNIASVNTVVKTLELVETFNNEFNNKVKILQHGKSIGKENETLLLDTNLFNQEFNISFFADNISDIARHTSNWHKALIAGEDMYEYSMQHAKEIITHYEGH